MSALQHTSRITPFLWFDANADDAAGFYVAIFPNSRRVDGMKNPDGTTLTVGFELDGLYFTALNGGPLFQFNESISFVVRCESQDEIDYYWTRLTADGGSESRCGWLKDRFGVSWQVIPENLSNLLQHPAAFQAMMQMAKLDMAELERAARA
jgi:predicted 3-demethylubiquinone-9 3-methyltransferase (glyoxalase superfamily)